MDEIDRELPLYQFLSDFCKKIQELDRLNYNQNENLEQSTNFTKSLNRINNERRSLALSEDSDGKKIIENDCDKMSDYLFDLLQAINNMVNCWNLDIKNKNLGLEMREFALKQLRYFSDDFKLNEMTEEELST